MKSTAFPDEYLAQLAQSKAALTSTLAMLCIEQRREIRKLEDELHRLRPSRPDVASSED